MRWWFDLVWGGTALVLFLWYVFSPHTMVRDDQEHPD
jgi:hypothetical protein